MPKGYTDIMSVKNYTLVAIKEDFKPQVNMWIEQVESYIEETTGRVFIADTVATERVFEAKDSYPKDTIWFDECIEIAKVEIDDVEVDSGDYSVYPANVAPKYRLRMKWRTIPYGQQNIAITAKWGYSEEVPGDIKFAATVIVAGIIGFSAASEMAGGKTSQSIGPYSVSYNSPGGWADFKKCEEILERNTLKIIN